MHECTGCSMAKGFRKGIPHQTNSRSQVKLGRVFVDLGGRKSIASVGGKHYSMIVKDDYTRRTWIYFLRHKSDAAMAFKRFLADVRADGFPSEVQIVRSDNGGEFFGKAFRSVCDELLIKQEFTPAQSPQFNGVAERGLGIIEAAAMAARIQAKTIFSHVQLPGTERLWAEAMHWACEALNHTACTANPNNKSPNEMWFGTASPARPYPFLKPAYCRWNRPSKLLPKAESCFYLGPPRDHPRDSLRVLTRGGDVIETRDVTWEAMPSQTVLPRKTRSQEELTGAGGGKEISDGEPAEVWPLGGRGIPHVRLPPPAENDDGQLAEVKASATPPVEEAEEAAESASESESSPPDASSHNSHPEPPDDVDDDSASSSDGATSDCDGMPMKYRRAMRQLETYMTGPHDDEERREGRTRAQNRALSQQQATGLLSVLGSITGNDVIHALIATLEEQSEVPLGPVQDAGPEPTTFAEARASAHAHVWEGAMTCEFHGLLEAGTFMLVGVVPAGANVVNAKWIYKCKTDAHGHIVKAKARLVAKGFSQQWGVDFLEVFSPTANTATIRLVLALANHFDWDMSHFDVEQAFVQSELDFVIFMRLPPGCGTMSGKIVRLNKSLYGLKQAARQFYKRLV